MKLTLVSGCDSKFYIYLRRVLTNIFEIINRNNNSMSIIVVFYDLGLTSVQAEEIKHFYPKLIFKTFNFDKYPEHLSMEKYTGINCSYAWKPVIIYEVCEIYQDLVHWFDTRNYYSNFNNIINILLEEKIYCAASTHNIENFTHIKTLECMDGFEHMKRQSRSAGVIGINYNIKWCQDIIKDWKNYSLIKECIIPEGSSRDNHRQDQSVLSILYYKYHKEYPFKIIDEFIDIEVHKPL